MIASRFSFILPYCGRVGEQILMKRSAEISSNGPIYHTAMRAIDKDVSKKEKGYRLYQHPLARIPAIPLFQRHTGFIPESANQYYNKIYESPDSTKA